MVDKHLVADDGAVAEVAGVVGPAVVVQHQIPVHPGTNKDVREKINTRRMASFT